MKTSSVVIIGAGVTGLSTAYHLALKGVERVIVLDKAVVGDGSSSRAAGIITGHLWTETGVQVRKLALRRFRELSHELEGYRFHDVGCLNLFDPPAWEERVKLLPLYQRLDVPFEILSATQMRQRWPQLTVPDDIVSLHDPLGGYSEPDEYLPALARRCTALGVEIREGQKVVEIIRRSDEACGVRTTTDGIIAAAVVCCSFAWINLLLAQAGIRLPVKSFVHQRYTTEPLPDALQFPAINANPLGGYLRPAHGNRCVLGVETPDREEWRVDSPDFRMSALRADPDVGEQLRQRFAPFLPPLSSARFEREHVGLITFSMDHQPLLGPIKAIPRLFVAAGFHSGGFAYNPASGLLLAESITGGQTSVDISEFSPDRFNASDTNAYLNAVLRQRDTARLRH